MLRRTLIAVALCGVAGGAFTGTSLVAQDRDPAQEEEVPPAAMAGDDMWNAALGKGWRAFGMAQLLPVVTIAAPSVEDSPLSVTKWYLTQPALMLNLEGPGQRVALRTTLNLEGITLEDGEVTFGGWGEGFIDKRHPHTILHEFMLSVNLWELGGGDLSLSVGKGFAPYGTEDPMARPGIKFPTNHHLSQILERWTVSGAFLRGGWSVEAGVFGGAEPEGPYDFSNIESFGDSWSARLSKRWGIVSGASAEWELSTSYGRVVETHRSEEQTAQLWNGALRHTRGADSGLQYMLLEASVSREGEEDDFFSILAEARFDRSGHQPYLRVEYAARPEFQREQALAGPDFFRYEQDAEPIGSTRWLISMVAYAYELTGYPLSVRPFAELQYVRVREDRGALDPVVLFGSDSFWGLSLGARILLGGNPMRMGVYGVLDPMTSMSRNSLMDGEM